MPLATPGTIKIDLDEDQNLHVLHMPFTAASPARASVVVTENEKAERARISTCYWAHAPEDAQIARKLPPHQAPLTSQY